MKIYGQSIDNTSTEDLEHRLGFLRRNMKSIDQIGLVELSFKHHQEALIIESELLRRKGA